MISISIIAQKLRDYDITTSIVDEWEVIDFRYISRKISEFNPYCLYIFKASNMPSEIIGQDKINFLIIKDKELPDFLLEEDNKNKYNYIILNNIDLPIYKLIHIIQDIFNVNTSLLSFQEDILNAMGNSKSLDEIIKISFNYLKNPIMLLNSMFHTCSYYTGGIHIDDMCWKHQLKMGTPHPTYSLLYNKHTKNRKLSEDKEEILTTYFPDVMKHREVTIPIRQDNFRIARISVLECNKALDSSDYEILQTLAKLIYPLILLDKRFLIENVSKFDHIMTYLLNTPNPNMVLVRNSFSSLDINNSNNKYLIVLKDGDNLNSITKINYVKQYIASLFSKHIVFIYQSSIIVVFDNKESYKKLSESDEYDDFIKSIKNYTLKAGISKLFNSFENLKNAYDQCEKAIFLGDLMNSKDKERFLYYFDDYVIHNMIFSYLEKEDINNMFDTKIKDLILSNNKDLFYTLYTYVQCKGDIKLTSEKLDIHYNTLKYRLNKIENLFNIDLSDENYLVNIWLSFLALDMKKLGGMSNVNDYE